MNLRKIVRPLSVMVLACLTLSSCSKQKSAEIEYFPYESGSRMYGMLSVDGKILFEDEFKNAPTVVRDGRFFVLNSDYLWEMYTATEHPKKVGSEYAYATTFRNGRALVAEMDKPVTIIDVDGKVVKKLDKIEGKEVAKVLPFSSDGYAIFKTVDDMFGVIDNDGDCTLKPVYSFLERVGDGVFLGYDKKVKEAIEEGKNNVNLPLMSATGKVLYEISKATLEKYADIKEPCECKIPVATRIDGEKAWGLIDLNGEVLVKPSLKIGRIGEIKGDLFTFENDGEWGLMNMKGETLIRAKYEELMLDSDGKVLAKVDDKKWKLIDSNDNQIGEDTYEEICPFSLLDGKHAFVAFGKNDFAFIDRNGKVLETTLPNIKDIRGITNEGNEVVLSGTATEYSAY